VREWRTGEGAATAMIDADLHFFVTSGGSDTGSDLSTLEIPYERSQEGSRGMPTSMTVSKAARTLCCLW
jgi:hypothetical protein